jgi:hypothetical protein
MPPDQWWSLSLLYLVFFTVVALLYVPCRWFAAYKGRARQGWTRYF